MKVPVYNFKDKLAWYKWRHTKVTASDANIIMGVSKFKTMFTLMREKAEPTFNLENSSKINYVIEKGYEREKDRREYYKTVTDKDKRFHFIECYGISDKYPWLTASFDGLDVNKGIVWECKLIGKKFVSEGRSGLIPEKYFPQIQTQLYVSGFNKLMISLYEYETEDSVDIITHRDDEYINNKLLPELRRFRNNVTALKKANKNKEKK